MLPSHPPQARKPPRKAKPDPNTPHDRSPTPPPDTASVTIPADVPPPPSKPSCRTHLSGIPLVDLARPILQELAEESGELARLSLPDGYRLVWVAKAQGASAGLRYDPDNGRTVPLDNTSTGLAWLSPMDEESVRSWSESSCANGDSPGADADRVLPQLSLVRSDGYSYKDSTYELGTAAVAVPIIGPTGTAVGVLNVAGPSVRLTRQKALGLVPSLKEKAARLASLTL